MKKTLPLILVLIGAALLIAAVAFWIDSSNSVEPQNFGQTLRDWITLLAGLGTSIKGWIDLAKKDTSSLPTQSNANGGIIISGKVDSTKDVIGRDQNITTNIVSEDTAYNVEGWPNPYLGLQAFTYSERDRYAGREKLTHQAVQRLVSTEDQCNLLFITGASGSGKSSFAQAGLMPALISHFEQEGYKVLHRVFRPSRNPKVRLDEAILPLGLKEIQVIIIDQFEELFTQSTLGQRIGLVEYLNSLPPFSQCHRFIIATLRSDYLGEMHDNMEDLWEIAKDGIPLRAMKPQEIKDAIRRPLQVRFPDGSKRFEKKLVEKLAEDTVEVTYLPLLQVTLEALWNKGELRLSSYSTLTDAIKERADIVWTYRDFDNAHPCQNRSKEDQDKIVELLLDLVNVSMDNDTKRDVRINRRINDFTENQKVLLKDLSTARLVSVNEEEGEHVVSLIHETLILNWDILRDSITTRRIKLQKRTRFETQLRLWLSSNRIDDYLLSKGQIADARELEDLGDIAVNQKDAQEFLIKSIVKIDAFKRRERMLLLVVRKIRELSAPMEDEQRLEKILEGAVSIFDCEAGTLFLVDDQTSDLIFRVTFGPVAGRLFGQRLLAGTGIVGQVVENRLPIIENDVQQSSSHYKTLDEETGFVSRSILAVPMQAKDHHVIGVIEIINQRDGFPFFEEDQDLLTVFAEQAVAIFEKTQTLVQGTEDAQARTRMVREMNSSLDVDRAMRITLEWAISQSSAEAGLIGVLEDEHLRLMAHQGYEDVFADQTDVQLSLDLPSIRNAIESGQPSQISLFKSGQIGILPTAHIQITIPIRRATQVIGLLLLESTSDTREDLAFLNRLSDDAAIAISNAQLFTEVQRANLAKSEFVSFVAHELKNPITSIKGYSELLAAGSVGQINEMQANFLSTIRANVQRMSSLVSDLNDNAKIEAGQLRLERKPISVQDVVEEVVRSTKRQIEDKKQTVEIQLPQKLANVWADFTRVEQVLINLLSNAHKYTPEGGKILIGAEVTANRWDASGAKEVVHFWIRDNGIGISIEDQAKIFQKFFRSGDSEARGVPGTGLGLNITKSLVEMMGGKIWFDSEFRKGTTFHFTIPMTEE